MRNAFTQLLDRRARADTAAQDGGATPSRDRFARMAQGVATRRLPENDNLHELRPETAAKPVSEARPAPTPAPVPAFVAKPVAPRTDTERLDRALAEIQPELMDQIDAEVALKLGRNELGKQVEPLIAELAQRKGIGLSQYEQTILLRRILDDMLGFGPLETLLADDTVSDILVNGPKQVYVERGGKLVLSEVTFIDNRHVMSVATRIVTRVGRRIDESSPLVDARLPDGSRINVIVPPLAIDGPSISIRKFTKKGITLDVMAEQGNLSPDMAAVLKIAAKSRLNILISGGTGSGKTTLLNAMSQMIDPTERVVTIEDAAELQLQQPHVVRLETRPANLEGAGEIGIRDLLKNALRMRPDRIIIGEIRAAEALDMLQAMNTGHDGSLGTIHASGPREALTRLENIVGMTGFDMPIKAVRAQIASAIDVIVQVSRMRDGKRRITSITEVIGMEGEIITAQELFRYHLEGDAGEGDLKGAFVSSGLRPHFMPKVEYFGLGKALWEAIG
jgi:pilus assembly protein CpaF